MLPPEDGVWCAGGGDDNIRAITGLIELLKQNHLAVKFPRQLSRAFMSAIGYKDRSRPMRHQVARSQFAHLPCANEIDVSSLHGPENLILQVTRNHRNSCVRRLHASSAKHSYRCGSYCAGSSWKYSRKNLRRSAAPFLV